MVDRWIEGNLQKSQFDLINVNVGLFVIKKNVGLIPCRNGWLDQVVLVIYFEGPYAMVIIVY